ncbi:hypothetical protein HDU86_006355 [Geranomyces michiganensis]|nr:hypothetical protein HDU86_006355 [Geranomyces michiganensis]
MTNLGLLSAMSDYDEAEDGDFEPPEDETSSDGDHLNEENESSSGGEGDTDSIPRNKNDEVPLNELAKNNSDAKLLPQTHIHDRPPIIRRPQVSYPLYSPEFNVIADERAALHSSVHVRAASARTAALAARSSLTDVKRRRDEKKRVYDALHEQTIAKRERLAAVLNALGDLFCDYANVARVNGKGKRTVDDVGFEDRHDNQRLRPDQVRVFLDSFAACAHVKQNILPHLV